MTLTEEETPTTNEPADETTESVSPANEDSPADSSVEDAELAPEAEETPEQKAEREKSERSKKRAADAEEAEKRAEAERLKRRKQREEAEALERVTLREQQANALIREAQQALRDINARREAISKGGFEALKALGIEYGEWTKKQLDETGPDALAQRALQEAKEAREELRRRDEQEQRRMQAAQIEEGKKRFEAFADANADDFPHAATLPTRAFRALADEAAQEFIAAHGYAPSYGLLLPRLDKKAAEFHNEMKTKSAKRTQTVPKPSDGDTTPQAKPGQPAIPPANPTLTPAIAGTRAKPPRQMTEEEVDEWARQELRAAMRADRTAQ